MYNDIQSDQKQDLEDLIWCGPRDVTTQRTSTITKENLVIHTSYMNDLNGLQRITYTYSLD